MEDVQLLKKKPAWYRRWWGILILVFIVFLLFSAIFVGYKAFNIYKMMKDGTYMPAKTDFEMNLLKDVLSPAWGADEAPITVVEFGDFNCSQTLLAEDALRIIKEKYSDKIKFYWRNYPVVKENSVDFAEAGVCAERLGKFWEFQAYMFANQGTVSIGDLEQIMKDLGVDVTAYKKCIDNPLTLSQLRKDFFAAEDGQVRGTPTFFINGHKVEGALPLDKWEEIIATLLK